MYALVLDAQLGDAPRQRLERQGGGRPPAAQLAPQIRLERPAVHRGLQQPELGKVPDQPGVVGIDEVHDRREERLAVRGPHLREQPEIQVRQLGVGMVQVHCHRVSPPRVSAGGPASAPGRSTHLPVAREPQVPRVRVRVHHARLQHLGQRALHPQRHHALQPRHARRPLPRALRHPRRQLLGPLAVDPLQRQHPGGRQLGHGPRHHDEGQVGVGLRRGGRQAHPRSVPSEALPPKAD